MKYFDEWTLVSFKDGSLFAASERKDVLELDINLNIVKKFQGLKYQPYTIDANENYLVLGYFGGTVDVHYRKFQKRVVSNCFYQINPSAGSGPLGDQ